MLTSYRLVMTKVLLQLEQLELWQKSDKETACLQAFRTTNYEYQKDLNPDKEDGTCNWCLQSAIFRNWQENDSSCLLWITADPGCGKSVLSKDLVDNRLFGLESSDTTICYFFFKDTSPENRSPANAVAALLHQVLKSKRGRKAMRHALPAYLENADKTCQSLDAMWKVLREISRDPECGRIIFVLDALDECETKDQKDLIRRLKGLERHDESQVSTHHLKVLVTSRPYLNIENEFRELIENIPGIRLPSEKLSTQLQSEMNHVVHARMSKLGPRIVRESTREELLSGILATENRTYLWLDLIFKIIEEMPRIDRQAVKNLVRTLPTTVDDVYNSILRKATDRSQAKKLLQIIVAATRPLSLNEIGVALAITEETKCYEDLELQRGEQLAIAVRNTCGLFVHIVDETVLLIHQSAKDFLVSVSEEVSPIEFSWKYSISISESALLLTSICIRFVYLKDFGKKQAPPMRDAEYLCSNYHFLEYSANNWAAHFSKMTLQYRHQFLPAVIELCSVEKDQYMDWEIAVSKIGRSVNPSPLHIASCLGLDMVVQTLLARPDVDVNSTTSDTRTPLSIAIDEGYDSIVKLLLATTGIDLSIIDGDGYPPLSLAILYGQEGIVKLLLDAPGIDLNLTDSDGDPPLSLAIIQGHEGIVKLLLATPGIDLSLTNGDGYPPLSRAILYGYEGIVKLLLTSPGIDLSLTDGAGFPPLSRAIFHGHEGIVKLLLATPGIDLSLTDDDGYPPLSLAILRDQEGIVKLLLTTPGIDLSLTDGDGYPPLSRAILHGHEGIVKLLLSTPGIGLSLTDGAGYPPLSRAIRHGHEGIVKLLLTSPGIDLSLTDDDGYPPLSCAILRDQEGIVKLLLATPGIDLSLTDGAGFPPLYRAILQGHEGIVKLLLAAHGIDLSLAEEFKY